jgi:hypothetical protein
MENSHAKVYKRGTNSYFRIEICQNMISKLENQIRKNEPEKTNYPQRKISKKRANFVPIATIF